MVGAGRFDDIVCKRDLTASTRPKATAKQMKHIKVMPKAFRSPIVTSAESNIPLDSKTVIEIIVQLPKQ
jgi:hypothetical protein